MASYFAPQQGPFDDAVMGEPIHIDDWPPQNDNFNNHGGGGGGGGKQKDKNSNSKKKNGNTNQYENERYRLPVQSRLEGFTIEKAEPPPGYKSNWTRAGRKAMKFEQKELRRIVKDGNLAKHWGRLTSIQRTVVNRLVEQKNNDENDKNANWVVADCHVVTVGGGFMSTSQLIVKQIRVILRRQDADPSMLKRSKSVREFKQFSPDEIIDLSKPFKSKNKEGKSGKNKGQGNHDDFDIWGDNNHQGGNNNAPNHFQGPPMMHTPQMNPHFDRFPPQQLPVPDQFRPMNQGPLPPPQAPMPQDHYPQQGPPPFQRNGSMRQPQFGNPFQPEPHINFPGQFDPHDIFTNDDFGPPGPSARERSHSRPNLERRHSSHHRNSSRHVERLEDDIYELNAKVDRMAIANEHARGGSSTDTYSDEESFWSYDNDRRGRRDYTPDSSPRSGYSLPRGSLEHARKSSRNRSGYRSKKYYDTDIVPARSYSYRENDLRRRDSGRSRRPQLHQSRTADDYPTSRGTQSRYLTGPRRVIEVDERYDYERDGGYDRRPRTGGRRYT